MQKNSVIVEHLEKPILDKLSRTGKYDLLLGQIADLSEEFIGLLKGDEELIKKYLELETSANEIQFEYENMCFCEGVRLGFKLCMDIFEL